MSSAGARGARRAGGGGRKGGARGDEGEEREARKDDGAKMASRRGAKGEVEGGGGEWEGDVGLSEELLREERVSELRASFREARPFAHAHVEGFLRSDGLLDAVREQLLSAETEWVERRNDLLDLEQSNAPMTASASSPLGQLRSLVYSASFRAWIARVTGVEVSATVDLSAARYRAHAFLSCHDDDLSERRVAFVLYLNRAWDAARDGGGLELYDADAAGSAGAVVQRLNPSWNSLALFEVSPLSFHQVNEVLRESDPWDAPRRGGRRAPSPGRMSISGWFHGEPLPRPPPLPLPTTAAVPVLGPRSGAAALEGAVAAQYLDGDVVRDMREHFATNASLDLQGFLEPALARSALLAAGKQRWEHIGPATLRSYYVSRSAGGGPVWDADAQERGPLATARWLFADPSGSLAPLPHADDAADAVAATDATARELWNGTEPDAACRVRSLLTSRPFAAWLAAATGLPNDALADAAAELRCFSEGNYTMICDPDAVSARRASKRAAIRAYGGGQDDRRREEEEDQDLAEGEPEDTWLCGVLGLQRDDEWDELAGGYTVVTTNDDELLRIPPRPNTLSLFVRGKGVFSFVRRITARAPENLYQIYFEYRIRPT
jgi:Rps23 Pro-64 3,4-dihydroxylase Tpa1-like proline 4-hydroxylase